MQKFCYSRKSSFPTSTQQGAHEAEKSLLLTAKGETLGLPPPRPLRACRQHRAGQGERRRGDPGHGAGDGAGTRRACVLGRGWVSSSGTGVLGDTHKEGLWGCETGSERDGRERQGRESPERTQRTLSPAGLPRPVSLVAGPSLGLAHLVQLCKRGAVW